MERWVHAPEGQAALGWPSLRQRVVHGRWTLFAGFLMRFSAPACGKLFLAIPTGFHG